ncbi:gp53-like domain-containing protein, partial [Cronobacter sakazakii]
RLGEAAKLAAASGSIGSSGWVKFPLSGGAVLIMQWGKVSVSAPLNSGSAVKGYDGVTSFSYPIAFPNAALVINATPMDSGETLVETATANINGKATATVRVGGVAIKADPSVTADLQATVFILGY